MLTTAFIAQATRSAMHVTEAEVTAALADAFGGDVPTELDADQIRAAQWAVCAHVDERDMRRDQAHFGSW